MVYLPVHLFQVPQNFLAEKHLSQSKIEYLYGDQNMSIFETKENIYIKEIFHVLTLNIDKNEHYIYRNVPYRVNHNSNFIVDLSHLSSVEDVKCNDGEAMDHHGQTLGVTRLDKD